MAEKVVVESEEETSGEVVELKEAEEKAQQTTALKDRKSSWANLGRVDSLQLEAGGVSVLRGHSSKISWGTTLSLAFQSVGVIYGDIGTSPLYVYSSTFGDKIKDTQDILGVLSLIVYTLILVTMLKYVLIVLRANDNGVGGTFALYSLICRHAKVSLIPNNQPEDRELSNYNLDIPSKQLKKAQKVKEKLENSKIAQFALFLIALTGTSMVIGDGVLTPSISVLSAVGGIKSLGQDAVVGISIVILITLFSVQKFGTDKVGSSFAPIILIWFSFIGGIGIYNLFKYDITVLRAFNPKYIVDYFKRNGRHGWVSLGGVFLCVTGTEAMFADLGHFNVRAIQLSFSCITFPALLAAYSGQGAYLMKHPQDVKHAFYDSIPDPLYWPTFVAAVAAAIIASQAMISGTFSIISQSLNLGCFPRVKVVHTSSKYEGQVYIPEVNYMLMIGCVAVTGAFRSTTNIGNAYGIAVVIVMILTTGLVSLIMLMIWKTSVWLILLFFVVFGSIEIIYLSSQLYKFVEGGFLPLVFAFFLMSIMIVWHYVHKQRYMFELKNKVSSDYIRDLATNTNINRIPGICLLYSELVQGIPPILPHFIHNVPSVHSVLVIVSIKHLPISKVTLEERFLFRQVEPQDFRMFRCVVRYGYKDKMEETHEFERQLVEHLKEFIHHEQFSLEAETKTEQKMESKDGIINRTSTSATYTEETVNQAIQARHSSGSIRSVNVVKSSNSFDEIATTSIQSAEEEMQFVEKAKEKGVVYLLGEAEVIAEPKSSIIKKIVVNYAYSFLRKHFRQGEKMMAIPRSRLLRVGMTYEI